jgi:hypothetical protein
MEKKRYIEKEPLLAYLENMGVSKYIIDTINKEDRFPTIGVLKTEPSDYFAYMSEQIKD